MEQRVLVCGGRDYSDALSLNAVLDAAHSSNPIVCLIHGAARGADALAADWAKQRGVFAKAFPADWAREGRKAGPIRNQQMLDNGKPHIVIAFPGGKGTDDMVTRADAAGVPVVRVTRAVPLSCEHGVKVGNTCVGCAGAAMMNGQLGGEG